MLSESIAHYEIEKRSFSAEGSLTWLLDNPGSFNDNVPLPCYVSLPTLSRVYFSFCLPTCVGLLVSCVYLYLILASLLRISKVKSYIMLHVEDTEEVIFTINYTEKRYCGTVTSA